MIGHRAFIAISWTLMIFCACVSDNEPPNTVKSLEKEKPPRPLTVPSPFPKRRPGFFDFSMPNSLERCSTNMSNSSNEPLSSRSSMRSRAVSLPRLCWASMRALPPPRRASSRRFSSLSRMSFIELNPCPHGIRLSEGIAFFCRPGRAKRDPGPTLRSLSTGRAYGSPAEPVIGPALRANPLAGTTVERLGFPAKGCFRTPMSEQQTAAELIAQGLVHHRAGQISLAMDRYTQVLRNDPRNADALYYIAMVACGEGQFQQGIDLARRSLAYRPQQARAHNLIGQALHRMGKIKDALESFDNAIACDANFADAYGNRAN